MSTTFNENILAIRTEALKAHAVETLQVNIGYRCNMACTHCHVAAGPDRREQMDGKLIREVIRLLERERVPTLDITGGAPELHPLFRQLVDGARGAGTHVMVRTNLTVLLEPGMEDLPEFLARASVEIIASLPSPDAETVDRVRGKGTFVKALAAMRRLNRIGFGTGDGPVLNLVHNPDGPVLPLPQHALESQMREVLSQRFGIFFDRLFTLANMPIGRFGKAFEGRDRGVDYLDMLRTAFNPETIDGVQCRTVINVGPDGRLYDCDFNQMLGLSLLRVYPQHIADFDRQTLATREIAVGEHCFACTAAQGST